LDYEVILTRWKSYLQNYIVNDTKLTVNLTNDRYIATLAARNLVGKSDASVLTIPAYDFQGLCR
jgi:interleukin 6 signal transducer